MIYNEHLHCEPKSLKLVSNWPGINSRSLAIKSIWLSKEHRKASSYILMCCPCFMFHVYLIMYVNWLPITVIHFDFIFIREEKSNIHSFCLMSLAVFYFTAPHIYYTTSTSVSIANFFGLIPFFVSIRSVLYVVVFFFFVIVHNDKSTPYDLVRTEEKK